MKLSERAQMWPYRQELPIEDYEYAVTGNARGAYGRPPMVFHLSPTALVSMIGGAFILGAAVGWSLAAMSDD